MPLIGTLGSGSVRGFGWGAGKAEISWSPQGAASIYTTPTGYRAIKFTSSGTLTVSGAPFALGYTVVGGGGSAYTGASSPNGAKPGGGGGGGVRSASAVLAVGNYPVVVGASDSASSFNGIESAAGGNILSLAGGSGRGQTGTNNYTVYAGGAGNTPPVSPPQGNPGGSNGPSYQVPGKIPTWYMGGGGGGGGAGTSGLNGSSAYGGTPGNGGNGGAGRLIPQINKYLAGGGGGGGWSGGSVSYVNPAGGGRGAAWGPGGLQGLNGDANTGGGAGSKKQTPTHPFPTPSLGGSGVVYLYWA